MKFNELIGLTIREIKGLEKNSYTVDFIMEDGRKLTMTHHQDCCERVCVEDVCGDIADLIGTPVLEAAEETSGENPPGIKKEYQDSFTWTFYKLGTIKGSVTIRWYGESNGYYSERVEFYDAAKNYCGFLMS